MLTKYFFLFCAIVIILQPNIVDMLNSSILGRTFIVGSILFSSLQNHNIGLMIALIVIISLNMSNHLHVGNMEGMTLLAPEEIAPPVVKQNKNDCEKIEKQMITPKSSKHEIITPEEPHGEPSPSDDLMISSELRHEAFTQL
jgi:hypothetical protein